MVPGGVGTILMLIVFTVTFHRSFQTPVEAEKETQQLSCQCRTVVFAFSGLRWDVERITRMSSIEKMRASGVHVKHKINAFQTESLPSFMTMSTGKYPNEHGIVANTMRDSKGKKFDLSSTSPTWYNKVDPIWLRNQKENGSSALCYWPGHDIKEMQPDYRCDEDSGLADPFKEFTKNNEIAKKVSSFQARLDTVKEWLTSPNMTVKPNFIGVYFEEPYKSMMKYGVHSKETIKALKEVNSIIHQMLTYLKVKKLTNKVNFVVTGESGVTNIEPHKEIFLIDFIKDGLKDKYEVTKGAIMSVYPKSEKVKNELIESWNTSKPRKHMRVYLKEDLPTSFHFKHKSRSAPITLVADEHWRIYEKRIVDSKKSLMGYDGKYESAHSLFVAQGPTFKEDEVVPALGNVDVFAVLCRALGISAGNHSGNNTTVEKLMRSPEKWYEKVVKKIVKKITETPTNFVAAIVIAVLLFFGVVLLGVTAIYKACGCCRIPMKVKVPSPRKFMKKKTKKNDNEHLLSEKELSDSDFSSSDEFYLEGRQK